MTTPTCWWLLSLLLLIWRFCLGWHPHLFLLLFFVVHYRRGSAVASFIVVVVTARHGRRRSRCCGSARRCRRFPRPSSRRRSSSGRLPCLSRRRWRSRSSAATGERTPATGHFGGPSGRRTASVAMLMVVIVLITSGARHIGR